MAERAPKTRPDPTWCSCHPAPSAFPIVAPPAPAVAVVAARPPSPAQPATDPAPPPGTRFLLRAEPRYHFRCTACGRFSDLRIASFDLNHDALGDVHELTVVAEGVCDACRRGGPLAHADAHTLRVLIGYLAAVDRHGLEAAELVSPAEAGAPLCASIFACLAGVLASGPRRRILDDVLARQLDRASRRFASMSLSNIACALSDEASDWPPRSLYGLLWRVARREAAIFRKLERRVAARIEAAQFERVD